MYYILNFIYKISVLTYTTSINFLAYGSLDYVIMTFYDISLNKIKKRKFLWNNGSYLGIIAGLNKGLNQIRLFNF
jgi:hypothetical protein